ARALAARDGLAALARGRRVARRRPRARRADAGRLRPVRVHRGVVPGAVALGPGGRRARPARRAEPRPRRIPHHCPGRERCPGGRLTHMDRRALHIALVCATLATLLLALYLRRYERELSGGEKVLVLALRKSVARGELLSDEALAVREIPMAYLEARAVRAAERSKVLGLPVAVPLEPAHGLLWSDLAIGGQARDLSALVQPGKRAVTVLARGAFDGRDHALIHPGDYVDVLVTLDDG